MLFCCALPASAQFVPPGLPPRITKQPAGQIASAGDTVSLTATPAASLTRLSFQWTHGFTDISGATNLTLVLTNLDLGDAGQYTITVANSSGKRVSHPATLTVVQTIGTSVSLGATARLTVKIAPTSTTILGRQWQFNGAAIAGATNGTLSLTNVTLANAGNYSVVLTHPDGTFVSNPAILDVDPTFTKITSGPMLTDKGPFETAAWIDYDNDGLQDLFLSGGDENAAGTTGYASALYHNNGDGTFTKITGIGPVTETGNFGSGAWGDVDNSGRPSLFLASQGGRSGAFFQNHGGGIFTKLTAAPLATDGSGVLAMWADFNNDGALDLFQRGAGGNGLLYLNPGDGAFKNVKPNRVVNGAFGVGNMIVMDFDNDGFIDVLPGRSSGGPQQILRNNGDGTFGVTTIQEIKNTGAGGTAWGDFDNDGFLDVFFANFSGRNSLYHNNGDGTFSNVTNAGPVLADHNFNVHWVDFDNDGFLDLYLTGNGGVNPLYRNNGDGTFTRLASGSVNTESHPNPFGAAWGDFDNNGFMDLFVPEQGGPNLFFKNNGNANSWVQFKLVGVASNRGGIGAKVRVKAVIQGAARWQMREVLQGNGYDGAGTLRAEFGLGDATGIDTVRIEWPSGIVQEMHNVAPKQFLTVTEAGVAIFPRLQNVQPGGTATFTAKTTFAGPLQYQWRHYGVDLPGQTNQILTLPNALTPDAGEYTVVVRDADGVELGVSSPAVLSLPDAPAIRKQPASQILAAGADVSLSVEIVPTATQVGYQWFVGFTPLSVPSLPTLLLTNATIGRGGNYFVVITNSIGSTTSAVAQVTIIKDASVSTSLGGNATFRINSGGPVPSSFQWRFNGADIPGATNRSYAITNAQPADVGQYSAVIRSDFGAFTNTLPPTFIDPAFAKITAGALLHNGTNGTPYGVSWGDYDGDGLLDLFVGRDGGSPGSFYFHNKGDGTFEPITTPLLTPGSWGGYWADYDNDGKLDLFIANCCSTLNALYHNLGAGTFERVAATSTFAPRVESTSAAWVDFDNDGYLDLLTGGPTDSGYKPRWYRNNGSGDFTQITNSALANLTAYGVSWGDYDNDGNLDLFIADAPYDYSVSTRRKNLLFRNDGVGGLTRIVDGSLVNDQNNSVGGFWADYDNDGYLDLFVANGGGLNSVLYHNNQDGTFTKVTSGDIAQVGSAYNAAWGDYDNDGYLDLFATSDPTISSDPQKNFFFHNNGDGSFTRIATGSLANDLGGFSGAAWGDLDNDGFLDLFVANQAGNNLFYRNRGNANNWIKFRCVGTFSNRSAVGAKVRVTAAVNGRTFTQLREISGGGGSGSQNELNPHFGLGDASVIDTVRIEWPSGIVQELHNVAAKQFLTVTEQGVAIFPRVQNRAPGDTATLTANATFAGPLQYQWRHDGVDLPGQTNQLLTLTNVATANAGDYTVDVRDAAGAELGVSSAARLSLLEPPVIRTQPQSQILAAGADLALSVEIAPTTTQVGYQWFKDNAPLTAPSLPTLLFTNALVNKGGSYFVVITNSIGSTTSAVAAVTIIRDTSISSSLGGNARLSINFGSPVPISIQWRFNGADIPGATKGAYTITNAQPADVGQYSAVIRTDSGSFTNFAPQLVVDPTFIKITTGAIVKDQGLSQSAAWGDFNNDGYIDLVVPNWNGQTNLLYQNNGDGTFTKIVSSAIVSGSTLNDQGAVWGDFNNDGLLDLFVVAFSGDNYLYRNEGNGTFTRISYRLSATTAADAGASWGDYDNDGLLDLFVAVNTSKALYHNSGDGTLKGVTALTQFSGLGVSAGSAWGDFDNDGYPDLFVTIDPGKDLLFRNNGDGSFTKTVGNPVVSDGAANLAGAWGDYNNDGFLDLYVAVFGRGILYQNNGDGIFTRITNSVVSLEAGQALSCAWGDYDNDGFLDLFVANGVGPSEKNFLFHNNGDGTFTKVATGSLANDFAESTGAAWGDYDNDGFLDLFVANGNSSLQSNSLYRNSGNSNNWINFKLIGQFSNRAAIGAKVRVQATIGGNTFWQLREISGGHGDSGQNDMRANFGLGDATNIDIVRIEWPSGIVQELHNVAAKQFLTVTEQGVAVFPRVQNAQPGDTATLTANATFAGPLQYQWRQGGVDLPGETNQILSLTNVATANAGDYAVDVRDAAGAELGASSPARLSLLEPPVIRTQPQSQILAAGADLALSVEIAPTSAQVGYQWFRGDFALTAPSLPTLLLTNATINNGGNYLVVITNSIGSTTSAVAAVTIIRDVSISTSLGGNATFRINSGGPIPSSFQWRFNGVDIPGATNRNYAITNTQPADVGQYSAIIRTDSASFTNFAPPLIIDPAFTKITDGPVVNDASQTSIGTGWADYNNDGYLDLLIVGGASSSIRKNLLYQNNRDGTFARITDGPVVQDFAEGAGMGWADYDNDGFIDLVVASSRGFLYRNLDGNSFQNVTTNALGSLSGSFSTGIWGDYDNDGWLDLFLPSDSATTTPYLYRNNGNGTFTRITAGPEVAFRALTSGASWADYDGDGYLDLFVLKQSGNNLLFHNNTDGTFTQILAGSVVKDTAVSNGAAWGDYDNDGFLDLFVCNGDFSGNGFVNFLYHNNGDGTFTRITAGAIANDRGNWSRASWEDFDNDGYLDLFVPHDVTDGDSLLRTNAFYHNNGDGTFTRITTGSLVNDRSRASSASWGDYDRDGFPDLVVGNYGGKNFLYRNNGNSNNWVTFQCSGRLSNRSAIGAKVRLQATINGKTDWQLRVISNGDGMSGNSLEAHFGLGDATNIDLVRIEWPSGIVQELHNVAPKQFLTVTEEGVAVFPRLQNRAPGETATLTANATFAGPLQFQWRQDGVDLPGETNQILSLTNVATANAGDYTVDVRDAAGAELGASSTARLNLLEPPVILQQPRSQILAAGADVSLSVEIAPTTAQVGYQWFIGATPLDAPNLPTLLLTNVQTFKGGNYFVVITNSIGSTTSAVAGVTIIQDASVSSSLGGNATLRFSSGGPLPTSIQWRFNGVDILGATRAVYTITNVQPANVGQYSAVIRTDFGTFTNTLPPLLIDPTFAKVANSPIVKDAAFGGGASWGDYNNDGWLDLIVTRNDSTNLLYLNNRDGTFTKVTKGQAGDILGSKDIGISPVWADFDNDGFLDLFSVNDGAGTPGPNRLFKNLGDGSFKQLTQVEAGPIVVDGNTSNTAAWADYDQDGFVDLVVTTGNGLGLPDHLYHNNGDGSFTRITNSVVTAAVPVGSSSPGAIWGDFDNDGDDDLFVAGFNRPNALFINNGDGTFTKSSLELSLPTATRNQRAIWGDFDNDGNLDLFVPRSNERNTPSLLFRNNGDGTFSQDTNSIVAREPGKGIRSWSAAWGDYDNDGFLDLFVSNTTYDPGSDTSGPTKSFLYHNNGDGTFTKIITGSPVNDSIQSYHAAWGDYDNDGFLDLFVLNDEGSGSPGQFFNFLYHNTGNANTWIKFKLVGQLSNRSAIGAKVRVKTLGARSALTPAAVGPQSHEDTKNLQKENLSLSALVPSWLRSSASDPSVRWQLREVISGGGYGSPNQLEPHFGLGNATNIDIVRVEWPSGIVQELHNVAAKQFLTVTEPVLMAGPKALDFALGATVVFRVETNLTGLANYQWRLNGAELPTKTNATLTVPGVTVANAGKYTVTVTLPNGDTVQSAAALLRPPVPPGIDTQPASVTVNPGESATFTVAASGTPPLTYQWSQNGIRLVGATNATLFIANTLPEDAADYTVEIRNLAGAVTSTPATLTIAGAPKIATPPKDQTVSLNGVAIFAVSAAGTPPFTYQWRLNGADIAGATGRTLTLTNATLADDGKKFTVIVHNDLGTAVSATATLTVSPAFTKITQGPLVEDILQGGAGSWGDFDGDGRLDVFLQTWDPNRPNALYRNLGGDNFERVTNALTATVGQTWIGVWGDYDNDGRPDLFVPHPNLRNELFHNEGGGVFTKVTSPTTINSGTANGIWVDFDRDGVLDLFVTTDNGTRDYFYRGVGDGTFVEWKAAEVGPVVSTSASTSAAAFCDVDGDGNLDLFISNNDGSGYLYRNDGTGRLNAIKAGSLPSPTSAAIKTVSVAWGDFDNDGLFDLLTTGRDVSKMQLHHNLGNWQFQEISVAAGLKFNGNVNTFAIGDYDNDGFLDIYVANQGGRDVLYVNQGDGRFVSVDIGSPLVESLSNNGSNDNVVFVDYDNDGFLDLFKGADYAAARQNLLYRNSLSQAGNTNGWLKFQLVGTASNRSAIGARLSLRTKIRGRDVSQLRQIVSGHFLGEGSSGQIAHFGLGDATSADVVRIEWPSGIVQELHNVAAKQFLTITEPAAVVMPRSLDLVVGRDLTLSVSVTNVAGEFRYQWRFNGVDLAGETNATLTLVNAQEASLGSYSVLLGLANGADTVLAASAKLVLPGPPVITRQPQSLALNPGDNATFSVTATGTEPLGYQWSLEDTAIAGATNATLALVNVQATDAGSYTVTVTNRAGRATSTPATLALTGAPQISVQPKDQSVSVGAAVRLTVGRTGTPPLNLQWRSNEVAIVGANGPLLVLSNAVPAFAASYSVVVSNALGTVISQPARVEVDSAFTKITTGPIVTFTQSGFSLGAAWGDYDNDGLVDLYVADVSQPSSLFHNNGDGTFTRITNSAVGELITIKGDSHGAIWGDYNNDGYIDLFVANYTGDTLSSDGRSSLFKNNGNGTFTRLKTPQVGIAAAEDGHAQGSAWADYDNDGYLDLFVVNYDGISSFWYHNNGDGTFSKITDSNVKLDGSAFAITLGDYNNDGFLDIFVPELDANRLYRNNADGTFTRMTAAQVGPIARDPGDPSFQPTFSAAWGDYDNDGNLDLFVANDESVPNNYLYHNNGDGTFASMTNSVAASRNNGTRSIAGSWADYDNDGFLDLFVANGGGGVLDQNNFLFHNNGDGTFSKVTTGSLVNDGGLSNNGVWADYDNDGFLDLFVSRVQRDNFLYRNNGNANSWLKLNLVGKISNRSAIGAKVRVLAFYRDDERWQLREVSGGGGWDAQNGLLPHFGLGDATAAEIVRVEWPSGIVQEFYNVGVKQTLTLTEAVLVAGPRTLEFVGGAGYTISVATNLTGLVNYQWRLNGVDLPGETRAALTLRGVTAASAGKYTVVVRARNGDLIESSPAILKAPVPPSIATQPVGATINPGENATFSVVAAGSPPLLYQWSLNGTVIDGATNDTLAITGAQAANVGDYTVVVRNAGGAVTSTNAKLQILGAAGIGTSPKDLSVSIGADAKFSIRASGTEPFNYQWRLNGVAITGATNSVFVFTNVTLADNGKKFSVVVRNDRGSATSKEATIHVDGTFTVYPSNAGIVSTFGNGAWGDYDGDGLLDFYLSRGANPNPNFLFHNNGDGTFSSVTNATTVYTGGGVSEGVAWGDYDNDGRLDLLVANGFGSGKGQIAFLFHNEGNGVFTRTVAKSLANAFGDFNSAAWADIDNDGYVDALLTALALGRNFLFRNEQGTNFVAINNTPIVADLGQGSAPTFADYDNDGFVDLLIASFSGAKNYLYHNNGEGGFTKVLGGVVADQPASGSSATGAWGDYDNDGLPDLYVPNGFTRNYLYHNNGGGTFTSVSQAPITTDIGGVGLVSAAIWGDYDNDGFLDLYVARIGQTDWMYHNNGDGTFSRADVGSPTSDVGDWWSSSFADFDNDGFLDLYVGSTVQNKFYRNNGNTNQWAKFALVGKVSNRSGIGAKVRVKANIRGRTMTQLREISTGDGWNANGLRADFGLGDATNMDTVRIEWPSGIVQELHNVAAKQFLTITEPEVTVSPKKTELTLGATETFTVSIGLPGTFKYQWRFNGTNLVGKTNATLVLNNAQPNQTGAYSVLVTNADTYVVSSPGRLTFTSPPVFTPDIPDQSASLGADVQLSATVIGTLPLFYQWYSNNVAVARATNATFVVPSVTMTNSGSTFRVAVTNQYGSATSRTFALTIDPTFTKITTGPVVTDGGNTRGGAWGDYNNDGFLDLVVLQRGSQPSLLLYLNNRDGTFAKLTTNQLGASFGADADALSASWGDYDNDGFLDLFVANGSAVKGQTNAFLYHNRGDGTFERMTTNTVGDIAASPYLLAGGNWADYDRDGHLDLVARAADKDSAVLYHNNGDGTFSMVAGGDITLDADPTFRQTTIGAAWADYDNDGLPDFFATNSGLITTRNSDYLYHNNGDGTFARVTQGPVANDASPTIGCAWGDYDNDGFLDLYVTTWAGQGGTNFLYHNEHDGTFTRVTSGVFGSEGGNSRTAAWGDYDNDGYLDLFVANAGLLPLPGGGNAFVRKNSFLYHNNGDGTFTKILTGSLVNDGGISYTAAWGDYNNDGFLDLFVGNSGTPPVFENDFLYLNNGNSNHWLIVKCVGTLSNRQGMGAKVRLTATIHGSVVTQLREISGNEGVAGTPPALAHFGLGDASLSETVRIEWPSGIVQELHGVAANQILTVTEPARPQIKAPTLLANGAFQFTLVGGANDVYRVESSADLKSWRNLGTVTNVTGQVTFIDAKSAGASEQFYRAVKQ
ncbi:MAG: VCBS repeat-containing protein [Verrucomicrobia bacterium]|nr:VCBS repeat-containing protein [Verrucomicrobiota bacterium]